MPVAALFFFGAAAAAGDLDTARTATAAEVRRGGAREGEGRRRTGGAKAVSMEAAAIFGDSSSVASVWVSLWIMVTGTGVGLGVLCNGRRPR